MKKRKTILKICLTGIVICIVLHSSTTNIWSSKSKKKVTQTLNSISSQLDLEKDTGKDLFISNNVRIAKKLQKVETEAAVSTTTTSQKVTTQLPVHNNTSNKWTTNTSIHHTIHYPFHFSKAPVNHIAFLKVHKSASSTAQNIFLRYGFVRSLNFVLPIIPNKSWPNIISTTTSITPNNIMPPPNNGTFDILCCHVIYNKEAFRKTMPPDTVFIGIVREPFDHFQSVLRYFRPSHITKIDSKYGVSQYLRQPWIYEPRFSSPYTSFTNNRMSLEFGFPLEILKTRNVTSIRKYLEKLSSEFLIVLVVEYFDESLVMMKRLLNWSLKDILYIKRNVSPRTNEFYKPQPEDRENYHFWASVDYALYDFFYNKLWQQIKDEGPEFYNELLHFKRIRSRVEDFCTNGDAKTVFVVNDSKWNKKFYVNSLDCNVMLLHEMKFVEYLRTIQYPNLFTTPTPSVVQQNTVSTKINSEPRTLVSSTVSPSPSEPATGSSSRNGVQVY